jgi:transposase InsO family protein
MPPGAPEAPRFDPKPPVSFRPKGTIAGAPLALKSDNGSAFRAEALKAFLRRWQVWPLYSPPGAPWYNGAIEASIRSLKTRTYYQAWRHGHADGPTARDLEQARQLANATACPKGPRGPTAQRLWDGRRPPSLGARDAYGQRVRCPEGKRAARRGWPSRDRGTITIKPRCIAECCRQQSCSTVISP